MLNDGSCAYIHALYVAFACGIITMDQVSLSVRIHHAPRDEEDKMRSRALRRDDYALRVSLWVLSRGFLRTGGLGTNVVMLGDARQGVIGENGGRGSEVYGYEWLYMRDLGKAMEDHRESEVMLASDR